MDELSEAAVHRRDGAECLPDASVCRLFLDQFQSVPAAYCKVLKWDADWPRNPAGANACDLISHRPASHLHSTPLNSTNDVILTAPRSAEASADESFATESRVEGALLLGKLTSRR